MALGTVFTTAAMCVIPAASALPLTRQHALYMRFVRCPKDRWVTIVTLTGNFACCEWSGVMANHESDYARPRLPERQNHEGRRPDCPGAHELPPELTGPIDDDRLLGEPQKVYSAPRRFDLATMFAITFAFGLLF